MEPSRITNVTETITNIVCNSAVNQNKSNLVNLTDTQWALLKDVDTILKPFMLAQELLEGEKYVTLSLVVSVIEKIRKNLKAELLNTEHSEYVTSVESTVPGFHC